MLFGDVDWEGRGAGQSPCMGHSACAGQSTLMAIYVQATALDFTAKRIPMASPRARSLLSSWALSCEALFEYMHSWWKITSSCSLISGDWALDRFHAWVTLSFWHWAYTGPCVVSLHTCTVLVLQRSLDHITGIWGCSSFFSVAMIKYSDQTQVRLKRIYCH